MKARYLAFCNLVGLNEVLLFFLISSILKTNLEKNNRKKYPSHFFFFLENYFLVGLHFLYPFLYHGPYIPQNFLFIIRKSFIENIDIKSFSQNTDLIFQIAFILVN